MPRILFVALYFLTSVIPTPLQAQIRAQEIVVKKSEFRLNVMAGDSVTKSFQVALGRNAGDKQKRGDNRTPEGKFKIAQIQHSESWTHDFGDGKGVIEGAYGPWFLRFGSGETPMKWKGIGIHGTHDPASLGTLASEGCIRLKNEDLEVLRKLVDVGTKVTVLP